MPGGGVRRITAWHGHGCKLVLNIYAEKGRQFIGHLFIKLENDTSSELPTPRRVGITNNPDAPVSGTFA